MPGGRGRVAGVVGAVVLAFAACTRAPGPPASPVAPPAVTPEASSTPPVTGAPAATSTAQANATTQPTPSGPTAQPATPTGGPTAQPATPTGGPTPQPATATGGPTTQRPAATATTAAERSRPTTAPTATAAAAAAFDGRRGMHLPITPLTTADFAALNLVKPGTVVVLSAQLGDTDPSGEVAEDPQLEHWLDAHRQVSVIVRMWPVKQPDAPDRLARRMLAIHQRFPWIHTFIPCNEPDIEWPAPSWSEIARWTSAVWQAVAHLPDAGGARQLTLLYPPFSQWSALDPEHVGYDAVRQSVETYLNHGGGLAGHEYWDRGNVYLVEDGWPAWLRARLRASTFYVTEAGYRPQPQNGVADGQLGQELVQFADRSRAGVVAPFILSDGRGRYQEQALVSGSGFLRAPLFTWASWTG